jgi:hypothetical protein
MLNVEKIRQVKAQIDGQRLNSVGATLSLFMTNTYPTWRAQNS